MRGIHEIPYMENAPMTDALTPSQLRKLRYIAEAGETRNPGNVTTTYSLVVRGLVEAEQGGKMPHLFMTYRVTDEGRKVLAEQTR